MDTWKKSSSTYEYYQYKGTLYRITNNSLVEKHTERRQICFGKPPFPKKHDWNFSILLKDNIIAQGIRVPRPDFEPDYRFPKKL